MTLHPGCLWPLSVRIFRFSRQSIWTIAKIISGTLGEELSTYSTEMCMWTCFVFFVFMALFHNLIIKFIETLSCMFITLEITTKIVIISCHTFLDVSQEVVVCAQLSNLREKERDNVGWIMCFTVRQRVRISIEILRYSNNLHNFNLIFTLQIGTRLFPYINSTTVRSHVLICINFLVLILFVLSCFVWTFM